MSIDHIRPAVELFYDMQKLRIATSNRHGPKAEGAEAKLPEEDIVFLTSMGSALKELEVRPSYQEQYLGHQHAG